LEECNEVEEGVGAQCWPSAKVGSSRVRVGRCYGCNADGPVSTTRMPDCFKSATVFSGKESVAKS
jgi:hypothetical protein